MSPDRRDDRGGGADRERDQAEERTGRDDRRDREAVFQECRLEGWPPQPAADGRSQKAPFKRSRRQRYVRAGRR